jgi:NADH-quinone oxidoreductase subunit H
LPWAGLVHLCIFLAKLIVFILFFIHVRWTVPRFRYDQIMRLGWIVFFEVALVNIFLAALVLAAPQYGAIATTVGAILLAIVTGALFWVAKTSEPDPQVSQA